MSLQENPGIMLGLIACLVNRLGGKVRVTQYELDDIIREFDLHSRLVQNPDGSNSTAFDLMVSSLVSIPDEPEKRSVN